MYGDAAYGSVASPASIPAITREDLVTHRETYWHPGAARIVISGGMASGDAKALANELFGSWMSDRPAPTVLSDPAGQAPTPKTVVIDMPDAGQAAVMASVRAVSRDHPDFYKLWLTNTVLGSGSNGRLFEEIRTKRALSYGAYSSLATRADEATLTAQAQTKNETADEVAAVFFEQFAQLGSETMEEDALQKRRLFLGGALARNLETSGGFNSIVASLLLRGIEPDEAFRVADSLSNVTTDDVARMASEYLAPDRASLVIVGDAQYFLDDLKAIRSDVEVIPFAELNLAASDLRKEVDAESGEAE
jgi:zinc protease